MRPDSARWERAAEVRRAAQGWFEAGAIDKVTRDAIGKMFPDPCIRPSMVWRALTAGMVTAIILCTFGAFWIAVRPGETGLQFLLFLFAGACLVATEQMDASPRLAQRGAAGATAFWAGILLLAGFGLFLLATLTIRLDDALDAVLVAGLLTWGASGWRWGNWLFAGFSAASLFVFLGRLPHGRVFVLLAGVALAALAARQLDHASWAPSHRRAAAVLVMTGIIAAYAAVNIYSLDAHLLENLRRSARAPVAPLPGLFVPSAVGTAVFPLVLLGWGIGSRRTFLIDTGIVLLGLSLVTLRHYVHIAPLWVVLTVSGAALVVFALVVERALRRAPGGELSGVTADPLFADERRQRALQIVPVVATFTPSAPGQPAEEKGFAGGGGRFGGGGAGEKF
jgi:hypothetical protein